MKRQFSVESDHSARLGSPGEGKAFGDHVNQSGDEASAEEANAYLDSLVERANLDSVVAGREKSVEYNCLAKIVKLTRTDSTPPGPDLSSHDDLDDHQDPAPSGTELANDPFPEIESENEHVLLFKFLFDPIGSHENDDGTPDLRLSDELIRDFQNLKDRMQHRYNCIKRNLYNARNHA